MMQIKGLAGAAGCVAGCAAVFRPSELCLERRAVSDPQAEIDAMEAARARYNETLRRLAGEARAAQGEEGAGIFEAYQVIAEDDYLFDQVKELIRAESVCASWAIEQKRAETEAMFLGVDDPYLQARAADINNVCKEITGELQGVDTGDPFAGLRGEDLIVFAEDLTPADTVRMDRARLKGMVTEKGGVTSHTVILAKALGIPAIVGVGPILDRVVSGQEVLVDGRLGNVVVCPDEEAKAAFRIREEEDGRRRLLFDACKASPARTKDGISVRVNINSGDTESINTFDAGACDGIGLFRTEFLYMGQNGYPSEDFQFNAYRSMAEKNQGRELIIRTLDIGGDKQLDYMDLPQESNPFLGYRAIRLCLDREEVFLTQLRAILRASAFGEVKIMFPMIVNLEELLRAKELLAKAMEELDRRGEAYHKNIPVGIMVETPAAVLLSDVLARHVDFFSIGSNDLIQYTTASDRMNEKVQYLYDSCNLSVLRSVKLVCDNARAQGVDVGICGETASEPRLIPLWCAMGVNELSVAPALVGRTKYIINQISEADMAPEMEAILSQGSIPSAREHLDKILRELGL